MAKVTNEGALQAIYEYAPDIKQKRDVLNAQKEKEKPAETLLSEENVNPEQAHDS
ncbi:hypothetical protein [Thalassomonas haliotis]|uniref:Transposase n=1 Tax=Thalassomonas haliotis TaxID=485448 RepID=A0ABY7V9T2_9GAMM|nr:hypothetical protein [Thalassomonas haliotis]WDE10306.1 hypothetical protein H3N35_18775 [Thalassomonas haliotis]